MNYFFHIAYNGFRYHGWQRQAKHLSIQEVVEDSLSKILKKPTVAIGCGRTDAGVHASQYFFHARVKENWDYDFVFRMNKVLPSDIALFDSIPVEKNAHAQLDAIGRTYNYFIHTYKDPFLSQSSSFYLEKNLNLSSMQKAAALLTQYNDYRSFCKSPNQYKHTRCNITSVQLFSNSNAGKLRIQITANRFLQGMVRAIVAQLLQVGKNSLSIDEFENLLRTKPALHNLAFAYPQGLYLSNITYPYLNIPPSAQWADRLPTPQHIEWINL
jgi:tRNA pseudouridine38-40 synthase